MKGRLSKRTGLALLAGAAMMITSQSQGATKFVDAGATGLNDGTTWPNAWTSLETALSGSNVSNGDELRVAQGTYKPTTGTTRGVSFVMKRITLEGGYIGNNGQSIDPDTRDPELYPTILSGEIGNQSITSDNSHHVVTFSDSQMIPEDTRLDGVTVRDGNAHGSLDAPPGFPAGGSGIVIRNGADPRIHDCIITANVGQAYFDGGGDWGAGLTSYSCEPVITNCTFSNNTTAGVAYGGAIAIQGGTVNLISCTIGPGNSSRNGGGIAVKISGHLNAQNCLIYGNSATQLGGGIAVERADAFVLNCTIADNSAGTNGGGYAQWDNSGDQELQNSIFWGNTGGTYDQIFSDSNASVHIEYCDIEGGVGTVGPDAPATNTANINVDPEFANPSQGNYRMTCAINCSSAAPSMAAQTRWCWMTHSTWT